MTNHPFHLSHSPNLCSISPSSALSFSCNRLLSLFLCSSINPYPPHPIPNEHVAFPLFCPNPLAPVCSQIILPAHGQLWDLFFLLVHTQIRESSIYSTAPLPSTAAYFMITALQTPNGITIKVCYFSSIVIY